MATVDIREIIQYCLARPGITTHEYCEIDLHRPGYYPGMYRSEFNGRVIPYKFPDGHVSLIFNYAGFMVSIVVSLMDHPFDPYLLRRRTIIGSVDYNTLKSLSLRKHHEDGCLIVIFDPRAVGSDVVRDRDANIIGFPNCECLTGSCAYGDFTADYLPPNYLLEVEFC